MGNKGWVKEESLIGQVPEAMWQAELEKSSSKYHVVAAWAAIIFDPVFAITDYLNIPEAWSHLLAIRLCVSLITLTVLILRNRFYLPSHIIVVVPFMLISLQNAYTYSLINQSDLLGHNLNFIALLIGTGMFVAWSWRYSLVAILLSIVSTAYFVKGNSNLQINEFFVQGGLILIASFIFMSMLVQTRYSLTIREIKARLALQVSNNEVRVQNEEIKLRNHEILAQAEEINGINENLENIVRERTAELEKKNKALEEYAFINAHKLRSPVASILGLINLMKKVQTTDQGKDVLEHLEISAEKLDDVVTSITKAIERGDKK
jgi:signal transduction histidine kinase